LSVINNPGPEGILKNRESIESVEAGKKKRKKN